MMQIADHIKQHSPILEVSRAYCQPKCKGNSWMAKCCFHKDKTASLSIDPDKGLFFCHGCGAGGDSIRFVQLAEGCSFKDACNILIERFKIPQPVRLYRKELRKSIRLLESIKDLDGAKQLVKQLEA